MSIGTGIWTIEEARSRFDEMLDASAKRGPQTIQDKSRTFVLTVVRTTSSLKGKAILERGGPLEENDSK
ncbi:MULTISPECIES: hypothetical protein [unclassified Mesorhizobium]|uniref:hypothetical protein n=1 Tax=unclassified Mesorhizobium TaxID=325217 RepID=UPI003014E834